MEIRKSKKKIRKGGIARNRTGTWNVEARIRTPAAWLMRLASSPFRYQESRLEPVRGEESSHLEDAAVIVALGELRCRGLVENERHIRMELQGRRGDGAGDGAFDGLGDGGGLGRAGGQQKDFAGFEDRADAHSDGAARTFFVGTEKLGVVVERLAAQDFEACTRGETGCRLVEADVSVAANAEQLEVDAACGANRLLVGRAIDTVIAADAAVRDVDVAREYVDVAKEMLVHEMVITLGMGSTQAEVFVEVESDDAGEIERTGLMEAHEMPVKAQHGISRGEAESE